MTRKSRIKSIALSATFLTTMNIGSAALAQEDGAQAIAFEELVITAGRREAVIADSPINISALSSSDLQSQRLDNLADVARFVPGITMIDQGPRANNDLIIRGLNADNTSGSGANQNDSVATYLGEVPMYLDFKLLDISRVEVLLGPQGTLYGQGTLAGAVRYIPNEPDTVNFAGETHMRGYGMGHSDGFGYQLDTMVNVPLVEDHLAFRGVFGVYNDPGFVDYPLVLRNPGFSDPQPDFDDREDVDANLERVKDVNNEKTVSTRMSLLARANEKLEALVTYAYQRTETDGRQLNSYQAMGEFGIGKYESGMRFLEPNTRNAHLVSLEVTAQIGDFAELVSASAYTHQKRVGSGDQTDLLLDFEYGYEYFPSFAAYTYSAGEYEQINEEIRLVSTTAGPLNWIIGGFYNKYKTNSDFVEYVPGYPDWAGINRPDQAEYASNVQSEMREMAVFGEVGYQFTNAWQVTLGGRYFDYKTDIVGGTDLPLFNDDPYAIELSTNGGTAKKDDIVYKINTSYDFSEALMAYATYSTGYRIGGPNRVAPCPENIDESQQNVCALPNELFYGPDETKNKEVGIRFGLFDERFRGNLSVYHIDWKGVQVGTETQYGSVGITTNGPDAVSKGVEFSFQSLLTEEFTLNGTFSYNDAHLTEDQAGLVDGEDAFAGDRLPGSPKYSGSAGLNYSHMLGNGYELTANYSATYMGKVFTKPGLRANGEALDDYFINSLAVSLNQDSWTVSAFVDNVFDAYGETAAWTDRGEIRDVNGFRVRRYGKSMIRPRTMGLEFRVFY